VAAGPLDATVQVPGSKSLTARYLVLAATAQGPSRLSGVLQARDTSLMVQALTTLGAGFVPDVAPTTLRVTPITGLGSSEAAHIDVGLAGTVMRFVPPIAALTRAEIRFEGDPAAAHRPVGGLLWALRRLGAVVRGDSLPFTVAGAGGLDGGAISLDATPSSQYLSALLLAAPGFGNGLTVTLDPPTVPSRPHVDMTLETLRAFGATAAQTTDHQWRVEPGGLTGQDRAIEPDLSNAAPFLAAALAAGGTVRIPGWPAHTTQPGDLLRGYLEAMGAQVAWTDSAGGTLAVTGLGAIHGADLDLGPAGELTPTLAALAALADTPSRFGGIGHLRGHETDRLRALSEEINALGGRATELEDGLLIEPSRLHGGTVDARGDHRLATFGAILGLAVPGVAIRGIEATAKTFPTFPELWLELVRG
jgi:3-phosphoshikimate 1-carboxyvinyltransferase